jgi:hypothetical protein
MPRTRLTPEEINKTSGKGTPGHIGGAEGQRIGEMLVSFVKRGGVGSPTIDEIAEQYRQLDAPDRLDAWCMGLSVCSGMDSTIECAKAIHKALYRELLECYDAESKS